eukprot:5992425-Lingulodinium_polyedra.AAC.1
MGAPPVPLLCWNQHQKASSCRERHHSQGRRGQCGNQVPSKAHHRQLMAKLHSNPGDQVHQ